MSTLTQIIADAYRKMVNPPAPVPAARPKWVPVSITEENVTAFVQAITEARKANESIVEFNGKKYGINEAPQYYDSRRSAEHENDRQNSLSRAKKAKEAGNHAEAERHTATAAEHAKLRDKYTQKEETNKEDDDKAKKIQDMDAENAPKQASDNVPAEVKEEDSEEIKGANVADKAADADDMEKVDSAEDMVKEEDAEEIQADSNSEADDKADKRAEMAEELSGNQKKLDVNHNGKIDGDDLKKLRGESAEADSDDKPADHAEPDADNMGGPSDHDADNEGEDDKDEDEKKEDEKPKMTGEQVLRSVADAYSAMNEESDAADHVSFDIPLLVRLLESVREDVKSDEDLHVVVEKIIAIKNRGVLTMADYDDICDCKKEESVKEETENDEDDEDEKDSEKGPDSAEAGPEVMDPATQKMKDAHNKNVEIKDGVPGSAQDGADDLNPADKPAPANKSASLPNVPVIDAPTKLK